MKLEESKIVLRPQDRMLKNFTDDLADGSKFSTLLHHLFPLDYDTHMVHEIDVEQRLANIERFNKSLRVESSSDVKVPGIVTADSIAAQRGLENAVFISVLFTLSPGHFSKVNTEKCRKVFLQIVSAWKKVRSLMLEVKRMPDDPLGAENMMVVTLGKEMRRVEELHTLLQKEMTSLVCASNESAGVLSKLLHKILCFTWRMLSQRDRGVDGDIIDERRADTIRKFTSVSADAIRRLISDEPSARHRSISDTEVMTRVFGIQKVLKQHFNDLHAIFRHYSCSTLRGHSATMSLQEYIKFIKDCNIVDKKVHLPIVDAIYHHCVEAQDDGTAQREMSPMDFVHALILVADKKFPSMVFEERIQELLDKCVLPNASRSQPEAFRLLLHSPDVRAVFLKYKSALQHIFKYYSNMKTDDEMTAASKSSTTLDVNEFLNLAKDCKLMGFFVTDAIVKQVFILVQRQYDDTETQVSTTTTDDELQIDFAEFEEALAVLTEHVICNPYIPLHKRLEQFVTEMVLPRARQKKTKGDLR
ncbi:hypothetical protein SPRG_17926 [Saprolegnia parasitica CBS 223.65]|uniref:Calponin-homology (CH) domain-containing protein n=1 Tax=Saprolegnia parasitica (strain CBS 223.65) TaxID=695850 RepID=A0A067BDW8_SAPPC|nr:hypothetical protein SPRG_17926 [Saprolegnia parasitica CBS 223.65]KDO16559.1 hypothetical protein SPRG_17926 [Saprolegnia parasitica CBS 223.65]|eukprot:XP_012212732.1 hypothetical protein SPRG_17926 [Saprolegnia parasitica CBS 223.65]